MLDKFGGLYRSANKKTPQDNDLEVFMNLSIPDDVVTRLPGIIKRPENPQGRSDTRDTMQTRDLREENLRNQYGHYFMFILIFQQKTKKVYN